MSTVSVKRQIAHLVTQGSISFQLFLGRQGFVMIVRFSAKLVQARISVNLAVEVSSMTALAAVSTVMQAAKHVLPLKTVRSANL